MYAAWSIGSSSGSPRSATHSGPGRTEGSPRLQVLFWILLAYGISVVTVGTSGLARRPKAMCGTEPSKDQHVSGGVTVCTLHMCGGVMAGTLHMCGDVTVGTLHMCGGVTVCTLDTRVDVTVVTLLTSVYVVMAATLHTSLRLGYCIRRYGWYAA